MSNNSIPKCVICSKDSVVNIGNYPLCKKHSNYQPTDEVYKPTWFESVDVSRKDVLDENEFWQ